MRGRCGRFRDRNVRVSSRQVDLVLLIIAVVAVIGVRCRLSRIYRPGLGEPRQEDRFEVRGEIFEPMA
jgi:hypothetical protein